MKKIGIVLLIILIFPVFVSAGSFSSDTSKANNYLQRDTFSSSYKKYLLYTGLKFGFENGRAVNDSNFTMGGFISEGEYKLTIPNKGSSYLLTGDSYWTLTPDGSKYKVIEYNGSNTNELNSYESGNTRPKARVTEYVAPNTSVSGTGRQTDPWIFDPMFRVDFEILGGHATINGSSEDDGKKLSNIYLRAKCKGTECTKTITLTIEDGYNFISDTCDGSYNYERNEYTVNNITKDLSCKIQIGIGEFSLTLGNEDWDKTSKPRTVYLRQRDNYYREKEHTNIIYKLDKNPERYGYIFKGYHIENTSTYITDATGKFIDKTSIKKNNETLVSDWQKNKYTITFNPNGGTINVSETTKQVTFDEAYGILPLAIRAGHSFKGWFTSATNNEQIKETDIVKYAGNRTLYAQWTICSVGTYNTGNSTTCTACPTGYTSAQGSTEENQCYMNVPGGRYLVSKGSTALPCEKGTSRSGEVKRYYGESVLCTNCLAGTYQNETGKTSCKTCPAGYNSGIKATDIKQCFITVPTGNKLVAKSTPSLCDAGTYRNGNVVKNYEESVSCTNCPAGTYSNAGASSCTNCASNTYSTDGASKCISCPTGYSVASGSGTSQASCTISVPAGKQLAAKASSATNCSANTWRSGPTTVAYGNSVSCSNCPTSYPYSDSGSTSNSYCYKNVTTIYTKTTNKCTSRKKWSRHTVKCGKKYQAHFTTCYNGKEGDNGWSSLSDYPYTGVNETKVCCSTCNFNRTTPYTYQVWVSGTWTDVSSNCGQSSNYTPYECSYDGEPAYKCDYETVYEFTETVLNNQSSCSETSYFNCTSSKVNSSYTTCTSSYSCSGGRLSGSRCYYY